MASGREMPSYATPLARLLEKDILLIKFPYPMMAVATPLQLSKIEVS